MVDFPLWPLWTLGLAVVLLIVSAVLSFVFWIAMLIDALQRKMESTEKIVWVLVIVFLHALGALI
ncbi:MAG: PLDc N-terminal domain-containing protein, partial [Nanoarchaeota archaeon]